MTVDQLGDYLKQHWPVIREQLLNGTYEPKPVRRVEIPKPDGGGVRKLGIPTVLDRFIQQAVMQVLQRRAAAAGRSLAPVENTTASPSGTGRTANLGGAA
jgi:retron-type reverse transcriptase